MTPTSHPSGDHSAREHGGHGGGHRGHGWMMIICCIPMLVIAGLLVLTGVASPGLLGAALVCTAMMALMMGAMHGSMDREEAHRSLPGGELPAPPAVAANPVEPRRRDG